MKYIMALIIYLVTVGVLIYLYDWKLAVILLFFQLAHNLNSHFSVRTEEEIYKVESEKNKKKTEKETFLN